MPMSPRLLRPRASGFSPASLTSLWAWFDASDSSTMTLNGSTVSEWRSKSGSAGIVLAQGTASAQPTLTQNYFSGRSALTFDGNDVLRDSDTGLPINGMTFAVVFDETTRVAFAGLLVGTPASSDDFNRIDGFRLSVHEGTNIASSLVWNNNNINALSPAINESAALGKHVVTFTATPSDGLAGNAVLRYDGVAGAADLVYPTPTGGVKQTVGTLVGGRFVGGSVSNLYRFNGRICEIAVWNRALATADLQRVERYLGARWGVSIP